MNSQNELNVNGINSNDAKQQQQQQMPMPMPMLMRMQQEQMLLLQMPQESGQQKRKLPELPLLLPRKKRPTELDYERMRSHDMEVDQGYESQEGDDLRMHMWC